MVQQQKLIQEIFFVKDKKITFFSSNSIKIEKKI